MISEIRSRIGVSHAGTGFSLYGRAQIDIAFFEYGINS